jgi:hypothetical protein
MTVRPFFRLVNSVPVAVRLETAQLFDVDHADDGSSPIDRFAVNQDALNRVAPRPDEPIASPLPGLVVLGAVSAVESYARELIRRLVVLDLDAQEACHDHEVSYGAAIASTTAMLPEALLEGVSFTSAERFHEAIKSFLGLKSDFGKLTEEVTAALEDYERIAHLRHCIVHRFGRLGSKNAIALGLTEHKSLIEKPLALGYAELQQALLISRNTVLVLNSFLFERILRRRAHSTVAPPWTWVYAKDRPVFRKYFELFYSKRYSPVPAVSLKEAYEAYRRESNPP